MQQQKTVFISYRRADSQYVTDGIHDHLTRHFGEQNVFLDVGSIPFGVDFRKYLHDQVAAHDVILVVIGPDWARIMQERAAQQNDFVRIEIENALKMDKLVIPVLVKNADMPDFAALPESIRDLQWRNSAIIRRQPDLEGDCKRLADGIRGFFGEQPQVVSPRPEGEGKLTQSAGVRADTSADAVRAIIGGPFEWCEVPAGAFIYGDDDIGDAAPREQLTLPAFAMAKYPVTYRQFQAFIDAKDGYRDPRWWEGLAADPEHREKPGEQKIKINDHPRERVSWYEAMAFARWLSHKLGGGHRVDDITKWAVRLPTEYEWEKAARGTDGRAYPWGDEFDQRRCNTKESGIGQTTPVTRYTNGTSPYGVMDMAGNVFDWCLTVYRNPASKVQSENVRCGAARVLRGGSFLSLWYGGCAARDFYYPFIWDEFIGLRVCGPVGE